ncbi:MAG: queuosine precursor transporter [Bacteroidales bacterium]|nr:queuosine precursor transporter [Bacteroidales bacterium]
MFTNLTSDNKYTVRREAVFVILSGLFVGSLAMLNILGLSRLIDLSFTFNDTEVPFIVFVGVLPYPVTFLCTDFISELYGRKRANMVVWVGLMMNGWVLFILWFAGKLPEDPQINSDAFFRIRELTFGATAASMIAYLTAQFVDVHIFHFLKKLTKGKHLWLRNNGSTLTSQLIDSVAVVLITYYGAKAIDLHPDTHVFSFLMILIISNYMFKMTSALLDTIPFYFGVKWLSKYLDIDPLKEFQEEKYDKE